MLKASYSIDQIESIKGLKEAQIAVNHAVLNACDGHGAMIDKYHITLLINSTRKWANSSYTNALLAEYSDEAARFGDGEPDNQNGSFGSSSGSVEYIRWHKGEIEGDFTLEVLW